MATKEVHLGSTGWGKDRKMKAALRQAIETGAHTHLCRVGKPPLCWNKPVTCEADPGPALEDWKS